MTPPPPSNRRTLKGIFGGEEGEGVGQVGVIKMYFVFFLVMVQNGWVGCGEREREGKGKI